MKRVKNIAINCGVLAISLILCAVALETGSFFLYEKLAPENGKTAINVLVNGRQALPTGNFDRGLGAAISEVEIFPYYLYRNRPYSKIGNAQQVNSEGYRNGTTEFGKKEKGKIRILAIGGSTTYGWLIKDYQDTWPSQLEKILNEKFDDRVEVINAGLPGGLSTESLIGFILKDKFLEPDIVIFHNGGNDSAPLFYKEYYPDYRYHRAVVGADKLRPGERKLVKKSNFIRLLYAFWMSKADLSSIRPDPVEKVEPKEALENVRNNTPIGFERNMSTLIEQTLSIGATPIIFPFHLAKAKVFELIPEDARYAQKLYQASAEALDKNKAVLKSLSTRYLVPYFEMDQDKIPLEYFFDHCHMKPEGDRIKAEFIALHVAQILEKKFQ